MNSFIKRQQNDVESLAWIKRFGWLRTAELGRLMWPKDPCSRTRSDRLVKGLLERQLVLARPLPDGAGRALVLSLRGAGLLVDTGINAHSGKDIGASNQGRWLAPLSWQHDLIAAGVLANLFESGYQILSERELRQSNHDLTKIPDGLAWRAETEEVIWLEVEHARKTGPAMRSFADAICVVSDGQCKQVSGRRPTYVYVAYMKDAADERLYRLDHRQRVTSAVALVAKSDVKLTWAVCTMYGCGVNSVCYEPGMIGADIAGRILVRLNNSGWREQDGCLESNYGQHLASVWELDDGVWYYSINDGTAGRADTKAQAMRGCAGMLAVMSNKAH